MKKAGTPADEIAPGIYRLGNRTVDWWAIETPQGITLVDAGLRGHMSQLEMLLNELGRTFKDVKAILLTHADVDHIGIAEDIRRQSIPVFIHEADEAAAKGAMRPLPKEALFSFWRPSALVATYEYARDGALKPRFLKDAQRIEDGQVLDVPGEPLVLHVPGHNPGSCAFFLADRGTLFTGDALVTADPLSGRRGPTLLPRYDNVDHDQALRSLDQLSATDAELVLPGHGDPWTGGIGAAVTAARAHNG